MVWGSSLRCLPEKKRKETESPAGKDASDSFLKMNYREFLETKIELATERGFVIDPVELNPALKPHQKDAVAWALKGGRRALFESFGLGKTVGCAGTGILQTGDPARRIPGADCMPAGSEAGIPEGRRTGAGIREAGVREDHAGSV